MTVGQDTSAIADVADVAALLERQRTLLRQALAVGVEVEGLLAQGDTDALTAALQRRTDVIAQLKSLDPAVHAAAHWLAAAAQGQRQAVLPMAQEVARLRDQVLEQVRAQEHAVRQTKARLASEAGGLLRAGAATSAYQGRRVVAARFMDRQG